MNEQETKQAIMALLFLGCENMCYHDSGHLDFVELAIELGKRNNIKDLKDMKFYLYKDYKGLTKTEEKVLEQFDLEIR